MADSNFKPAPNPSDLLEWYDRHARVLPWRILPQDRSLGEVPDPYRIWLSEIMLQQTTVATVKSYFEKFTSLWPSIHDLAKADREEVLKAWAGLGYYSRARNLKACADIVARDHGGIFPDTVEGLKALPGIGDYTACAIAAIAFDQPAAVVDGNVERVLSRVFAVKEAMPKAKKTIKEYQSKLTPQKRAGDYAQAMMDLGATICSPKNPTCALCVWQGDCAAYKLGTQEFFPVKAPKKIKPTRYGWAFVAVRADGAVLLRTRPDKGLLGGMTEVPGTPWGEEQPKSPFASAPFQAGWSKRCGVIQHTFTHFHLEVEVVTSMFPMEQAAAKNSWWSAMEDIPNEALPTVMNKMLEAALPGVTKPKA